MTQQKQLGPMANGTSSPSSPGARRRGRPRKVIASDAEISREAVLECAFAMTGRDRLDELSMVRVATEMGVSPSLVHYYLENRDALTSGVLNRFFKAVCNATPQQNPDARRDIEAVARASHGVMLAYPGVVDYLAAHNRFRLVQKVQEGEVDYGVRAFERMAAAIMRAGHEPADAAMLGHLIRMFVLSSAQAEAHFQTPGFHKSFLDDTLQRFPPTEYPGLHHSLHEFASLNGNDVFGRGLEILLDGFERTAAT
jgi:AcrR family transcriptional regulator